MMWPRFSMWGPHVLLLAALLCVTPMLSNSLFKFMGRKKSVWRPMLSRKMTPFHIALSGWQEASDLSLFDFLNMFKPAGLTHVLCTDINRDGTLQGLTGALYQCEEEFPHLQLQASGGASRLEDLKHLDADGVIIGKALYEGCFSIAEALEATAC